MREIAQTLLDWLDEGRSFAVATVIQTSGSSPRGIGSAMGVREDGLIAGSVSGGCVEGAVVDAALTSLKAGKPKMLEFGSESDAVLWEVGLSCGGQISVWVEPVLEGWTWKLFFESVIAGTEVTRLTQFDPENPRVVVFQGETTGGDREVFTTPDVFVDRYPAPDRLIIVGAVHIALPLIRFAKELGWETIVIEPREVFARPERFPTAPDRILNAWPDKALDELGIDERTYVVTLTHDPKLDDPALFAALKGKAAYVGALGGRKTQAKKRETLAQMGLSDEELNRIHGPIGLDIGAESPEEIALSIIAQIVQVKRNLP